MIPSGAISSTVSKCSEGGLSVTSGDVGKVTNISLLLAILGKYCEYIDDFSWHLQPAK